jgi:glyoxylase-like metal-dependent hydrolase (beta-lactamase superfamily II)
MRQLGFDPAGVDHVIVTHAHNDHFGGARHLQEARWDPGAKRTARWHARGGSRRTVYPTTKAHG